MDTQRFEEAQAALFNHHNVDVRSVYVKSPTNDGRVHVLVAGKQGPPVVMVNGIGLPAAMWAPLMPHLGDFQLFALDQPGFGLTDVDPDAYTEYRAYVIGFLAGVVQQLQLSNQPSWIANSLGARWTIWLADKRPDLVRSSTFIACPALFPGTSAPIPMRLLSLPPVGRALTALSPPTPKTVQRTAKMVKQYPLASELEEMLVATERLDHYRDHFLSTLHLLLNLKGSRPEMAIGNDELTGLNHPVQMIWGRDDPFGDVAVGKTASELIPNCEFRVVGGGHAPWFSNSDEIGPLVASFLKDNS